MGYRLAINEKCVLNICKNASAQSMIPKIIDFINTKQNKDR